MNKKRVLMVTAVLFLALLPLVNKIDFPQNDDWVYYEMVSRFMVGDYKLNPLTGPTFYTQGIIASIFAKIFTLKKLPILTLIFSAANFYLLTRFINERLKRSLFLSISLGLLFFFSPHNIYLSLGFMTGVYFMFFMLLSLWFYDMFIESKSKKHLIYLISAIFLGLVLRQVSLFIPLGLFLFHLYKREFKLSGLFLSIFAIFFLYYQYIFPLSPEIYEKPLQLQHLFDFDYAYALVYGVLIVLVAALFPLFIGVIDLNKIKKSKVGVLGFVAFAGLLYYLSGKYFDPHEISWGEFPFFENTWERKGFYPRGINGNKYRFRWNYDLYYYWDIYSRILLPSALAYIVLYKKKIVNVFGILGVAYMGVLLVSETFYDRYVYILLPLTILYFAKALLKETRFLRYFLSGFILFSMFYSYLFAYDFVLSNEYVWHRSEQIAEDMQVDKKYIQGTNAWKLLNRNIKGNYKYDFSYDSPKVNQGYREMYSIIEVKEIKFPGSIFLYPKIYLYEKN